MANKKFKGNLKASFQWSRDLIEYGILRLQGPNNAPSLEKELHDAKLSFDELKILFIQHELKGKEIKVGYDRCGLS